MKWATVMLFCLPCFSADLQFNPSDVTVKVGETFTVAVELTGDWEHFCMYDLVMTWPEDALTGLTEATTLATFWPTMIQGYHDDSQGDCWNCEIVDDEAVGGSWYFGVFMQPSIPGGWPPSAPVDPNSVHWPWAHRGGQELVHMSWRAERPGKFSIDFWTDYGEPEYPGGPLPIKIVTRVGSTEVGGLSILENANSLKVKVLPYARIDH